MAKRTMNKETAVKKVINMIWASSTCTWEDAAEAISRSVSHTQKIVKAKYKTEGGYNRLLEKARENKKRKKAAEALLVQNQEQEEQQDQEKTTVIVTETSYLMKMGADWIQQTEENVYIPRFCLRELRNMRHSVEGASELLAFFGGDSTALFIDLRGREELFVKPEYVVKPRTIGIVATCLYLCCSQGYHVKLLSYSKDVQELAETQLMDIEVVRTGGVVVA